MLDTTEAAITQAYVFHEWLVDATPWTKPQIPLTTSHSIFMSWAAANRPEVEKWKKQSNNNWKGFKQWYYWEINTINWSKKGFVFLQITTAQWSEAPLWPCSSEVKLENINLGVECNGSTRNYNFLLAVHLCIWLGIIIFIVILQLLGNLDEIKKLIL